MFQNRFTLSWPDHSLWFGGGGPSKEQIEEQKRQTALAEKQQRALLKSLERSSQVHMPAIPAAPPPVQVPPPPTQQQADIEDAEQDARRMAASRYGFLRTTGPGSTGGYMSGGTPLGSSNAGGRPVLG